MRRSGRFASYTGPSALRRSTPISRTRMRRIVATRTLPSFSPLCRWFSQLDARLPLGDRQGYWNTWGTFATRAWWAWFTLVRFVLSSSRRNSLVNIRFLRCLHRAVRCSLIVARLCRFRANEVNLLSRRLCRPRTYQFESRHAPCFKRIEMRLLLRRCVLLRARTKNIRTRGSVSSRCRARKYFIVIIRCRLTVENDKKKSR